MIATYRISGDVIPLTAAHAERFWAKVEKGEGCWLWRGSLTRDGYGQLRFAGRTHQAHRVAYTLLVGAIPDGLSLDHLCRVHRCVNPAHLEAVTPTENTMRGETITAEYLARTHCPKGHPFSGSNLVLRKEGRVCRTCNNERQNARRARLKAAAQLSRDLQIERIAEVLGDTGVLEWDSHVSLAAALYDAGLRAIPSPEEEKG
jgi:hypothetical protein